MIRVYPVLQLPTLFHNLAVLFDPIDIASKLIIICAVKDNLLPLKIVIRLSGKFMQLVSKRISETFGFCHSIEGEFLLRYANFGPIGLFPSYEKKTF